MSTQVRRKIFTHDFILAFFAQFVFTSVFYLLIPTLPIYLSRWGSTEIEIGVLIGAFFLSSVVFRLFVGRALLKIPEKRFMLIGTILFALTSIAYILTPPFWPLLIVRVFQGIGFAFFHTAIYTLIANISLEGHRGQSLSYFTLAMTLSGAIAPSVGMILINQYSFTYFFLVCLGLSLCSLFITLKLERRPVAPSQDSLTEDRFFLNRKALPPSIVSSLSLFIWGALTAFFPLYAIHHGVTNPGLFFTTIAIMLLLVRSLAGKTFDLYSKEKVILPCLTTYIISMAILAFSKTLPMFILVAVIWGIGNAFLMPSLVAYALDHVGSSPGPIMGTFTAITDLGISLGPVVMGIVVHEASYPIMFLCLALTGFINLGYFYFILRKERAEASAGRSRTENY
jgi:MFS family permease